MTLTKEEVLEVSNKYQFSELVVSTPGQEVGANNGMDSEFMLALEQGLHLDATLLSVDRYKL